MKNLMCTPTPHPAESPTNIAPPVKEKGFLYPGIGAFPGTVPRHLLHQPPTHPKFNFNGFQKIHTVDPRNTINPTRDSKTLSILTKPS
tara:strand:+ start:1165 stop:1428 length:264 start_codon:yes stop_codon:yes gene_type:complete